MRLTHEQRLINWLGAETVERISACARDGYSPPVAIANVPGLVYAMNDGGFCGPIRGGYFANLADFAEQRTRRIWRNFMRRQYGVAAAGFTSMSDLISEATTGGKAQNLDFTKAGVAGVAGRSNSLWGVGPVPPVGAAGGTTGTGAARTSATAGALVQKTPAGGDTLHITTAYAQASVAGQILMLYDRLWDMTHTMTLDPRSCDALNPPTRYQTAALAPGNFFSGEVTTVLPAATPTITLDYVNQAGTNVTGAAFSTIASAAAVGTIPLTAPNWKYPLTAGDTGLRSLQNSANAINLSAAMASGVVTWFIGHPLAYVPMPAANTPVILDGINSAFNLERIYDDACLAFLELAKSATTATNWWGSFRVVAG